jgi:hypothetical protein
MAPAWAWKLVESSSPFKPTLKNIKPNIRLNMKLTPNLAIRAATSRLTFNTSRANINPICYNEK